MAAEDFFARWSKKNAGASAAPEGELAHEAALPRADAPGEQRLPTLEDVARLTPEADFSAFMTQGVAESVKRAAMKKLFSDPHFNVMDGLDVYIEDYNSFEALTPGVIARLNHAKELLDPLAQCSAPTMRLLDALSEDDAANAQNESAAPEQTSNAAQNQIIETNAEPADEVGDAEPADPQVNESDASHSQP